MRNELNKYGTLKTKQCLKLFPFRYDDPYYFNQIEKFNNLYALSKQKTSRWMPTQYTNAFDGTAIIKPLKTESLLNTQREYSKL